MRESYKQMFIKSQSLQLGMCLSDKESQGQYGWNWLTREWINRKFKFSEVERLWVLHEWNAIQDCQGEEWHYLTYTLVDHNWSSWWSEAGTQIRKLSGKDDFGTGCGGNNVWVLHDFCGGAIRFCWRIKNKMGMKNNDKELLAPEKLKFSYHLYTS